MAAADNPLDFLHISWLAEHPDDPVPNQERCVFHNRHPNRSLMVSAEFSGHTNFPTKQAFSPVIRDFFPNSSRFESRPPITGWSATDSFLTSGSFGMGPVLRRS